MSFLSKNLSRIKQSPTMEITARAQELKANGLNIISLSVGEPDFDTPQNIKEAGIAAINQGKTKYTAVDGMPELKEAICNKFQKDNELTYSKDQVIILTCRCQNFVFRAPPRDRSDLLVVAQGFRLALWLV